MTTDRNLQNQGGGTWHISSKHEQAWIVVKEIMKMEKLGGRDCSKYTRKCRQLARTKLGNKTLRGTPPIFTSLEINVGPFKLHEYEKSQWYLRVNKVCG